MAQHSNPAAAVTAKFDGVSWLFLFFFICFVFLLFSVWSVVCRHSGLVLQFTRNSNNAENSSVFILLFVFRFSFYFTLCFSLSLSPRLPVIWSPWLPSSSGVCLWQLSRSLSLSVCVCLSRALSLFLHSLPANAKRG
jgi:hypothetical protein